MKQFGAMSYDELVVELYSDAHIEHGQRRCDLALAEAASLLVAAATKKRMIESFILSIYFLVSIGRLNNQFKVVRRYNNEDSVVKENVMMLQRANQYIIHKIKWPSKQNRDHKFEKCACSKNRPFQLC